jgi:hypothetical protein
VLCAAAGSVMFCIDYGNEGCSYVKLRLANSHSLPCKPASL